MANLNIDEMRDYKCWLKHSPAEILFQAKAFGGWAKIFPGRVPPWASKVRNYFNVLPTSLARLPQEYAEAQMASKNGPRQTFLANCHEVRTFNDRNRGRPTPLGPGLDVYPAHKACPAQATKETMTMEGWFPVRDALSGDVYLDDHGWIWYQMSAGATIFHWGGEVKGPKREAVYTQMRGQENVPVFKLIRMDGSGGSCEVILMNYGAGGPQGGKKNIGNEDEYEDIYKRISRDKIKQGSYNYSETSQVGFSDHEKRDVKTHVAETEFYSNPINMHAELSIRRFPPNDNRGIPLAMQTEWWF
ncbi:hypothetical protein NA78x_006278 [Anatilimnocola sp. NA78]|uniref:hypothetical protein n=1 Tax=Anatilimnocola sp. NA78 TaxID=3415683 RepID=UPI003CE546E1